MTKDRWEEGIGSQLAGLLARWTAVWKRNEKVCPFLGEEKSVIFSGGGKL